MRYVQNKIVQEKLNSEKKTPVETCTWPKHQLKYTYALTTKVAGSAVVIVPMKGWVRYTANVDRWGSPEPLGIA